MKLVKYLFKRFIPIFIGSIGFFSLVLILVDLMMNLWKFIQNESAVKDVLRLMLLYFPKTLSYSIPLGVLFAVSYSLSDLYANNELTAVFACGVSLFKFTLPLLIFSIALSFGLLIFDDLVIVPTYKQKQELQQKLLGEHKSENSENIVVISDSSRIIYKAKLYESNQKRLYDLYLVYRTDDKKLDSVIHADSAFWNQEEQKWHLSGVIQYLYNDGEIAIVDNPDSSYTDRLNEPAETFKNNTINVESVNIKEAKAYINHLRRVGLPFQEELSVYYKKFAFPFIIFVVVFMSIGLSGKSRKNVLLISLSLSVASAVLFYVMQMVTMILAKFGYITPFMGAWFPVFIFVIASIVLMRYART
ncbi:MAG: LptF/LptG family permease [Treponema sp.]|nr:LptF/LptG family permease [Treponema sp.]